ncbi:MULTISPECIES: hypothetical protein [Peribacillus]|uniref:hypothetical protein n=1 Tax=Peribacillus TaxID=2675229 RepID=UPI00203FEA0F|nr:MULTISPECIES: hypothetical protein [Peribacillus]MCM3675708.1 hypothetical protein [Peribacillus simplex]MDQ0880425.1 hypothetical protein [Peribacillus sp. V2I11]
MKRKNRLVFTRSNAAAKRKFDEAITILEYSVMLVEFFGLEEFNNIIAGQLRLILCETKNTRIKREKVTIDQSLIKKINPNPKLYPIKDSSQMSNVHITEDLFDYTKQRIELKLWRNQIIYKTDIEGKIQEIKIIDFIKETANKIGGAQAESSFPNKSMILDGHTKIMLIGIAKGLFKSIGRDYKKHASMNLSHIIQKIEQSTLED